MHAPRSNFETERVSNSCAARVVRSLECVLTGNECGGGDASQMRELVQLVARPHIQAPNHLVGKNIAVTVATEMHVAALKAIEVFSLPYREVRAKPVLAPFLMLVLESACFGRRAAHPARPEKWTPGAPKRQEEMWRIHCGDRKSAQATSVLTNRMTLLNIVSTVENPIGSDDCFGFSRLS